MRDLELWRRLVAGTAGAADLAPIAAWPLARRGPLLAWIAPLVESADRELRAAATRALAGARGVVGVRAIVRGLSDDDDRVREAAVEALRATSRDAPHRFAHALFHPRADVRRAAIAGELTKVASDLAVHLRADAECAARAAELAWPEQPLPLAFDLYELGHVTPHELVALVLARPVSETRAFLSGRHHHVAQREPEVVYPFLQQCTRDGFVAPPGRDIVDVWLAAIVAAGDLGKPLAKLVDTVVSPHAKGLARRAQVSLIAQLARDARAELAAAAVALDPAVLAYPGFRRAWVDAALPWLVDKAPAGVPIETVDQLLALPLVREPFDLALAAALAALYPNQRLKRLADAIGHEPVLRALIESNRGWDVICKLPPERPGVDEVWLAQIEKLEPQRYLWLAGRAIAIHTGDRLEAFVDQLPRRVREQAFLAALTCDRNATGERLATTCAAIAPRIDRAGLAGMFDALVKDPANALAVRELVRAVRDKPLASAAALLDDATAVKLVAMLDGDDPPPRDREVALASAFVGRTAPELRAWVEKVSSIGEPRVLVAMPPLRARRALDAAEARQIATCATADLARALAPALSAPVSGLAAALASRPAASSVIACVALLGCADPLEEVARELERFGASSPTFDAELDNATATHWLRHAELPPLAHARLWRWEAHGFALAEWLANAGGVTAALGEIQTLAGALARRTLWRGIAAAVTFWRYRDEARFRREVTPELATYCAARVDHDIGRNAAAIVVAAVEGRAVALATVRDHLLAHAADADADARAQLARLVRLDGMPIAPTAPPPPPPNKLAQIRGCTDLDALIAWCRDESAVLVQEAALVLCAKGELGQQRLAELLRELTSLPQPLPIVQSVVLWDSVAALAVAREVASGELPPAWLFHLCVALAAHGDADALSYAIAAARFDDTTWTLRPADWEALTRLTDVGQLALALVDSPHHHAYRPALGYVLALEGDQARDALHRFLEVDGERPRHLRIAAAHKLVARWSDPVGLPLLVELACEEKIEDWTHAIDVIDGQSLVLAMRAIVDAALAGGHNACSEKRMWAVIERAAPRLEEALLAEIYLRVLDHAQTAVVRRGAAPLALAQALGHTRLLRVADVFAWGVRRGVELAGRMFKIHLTSAERDFGHTRLDSNRIFVSPLPMLRDEPYGKDIVEGLVLHEIGHHVYHRGEAAQALWARAHKQGLGHLLNLVADEHLERNLRALDPEYGDRLKRLGAYAFQHAPQEIKIATLVASLRGQLARALIGTPLDVAFDEASLRLRRGAVLAELDRAGHPLARFARALRMGLGNRSGDPRIAAALDRCKRIRDLDMQGLYDLTRELAEMFGGSIEAAKVFGGPEGLEFGERDDDVFGAGVDDDILQREVERILHPSEGKSSGKLGPRDRLAINVNPDEDFQRITHVERVRGDPTAQRELAADVHRHATRLRAFLDDLGLRWLPSHARTRGRALDRPRLRSLVTRGDPRILIAREPSRKTDLFLGTLVDCSGSMQAGDNIGRARRFAALVAEAVRPLDGVAARFFGFTDSTIYDAGDARDCHVTALAADGGNNDTAALFHAANIALGAPQRAKVLVMISDGLPTECSVSSLRGLVTKLTKRKGIVCAQVALRKLEEVCFPHHVVLDDHELDVAVAKFGRMIGDLARRSLAS